MLTTTEAIELGIQIGDLAARTRRLLADKDTELAAETAWRTIRAALAKAGPRGRRVTKDERKAVYRSLLNLLASHSDVNLTEASELQKEVVALGHKLVEDVLD